MAFEIFTCNQDLYYTELNKPDILFADKDTPYTVPKYVIRKNGSYVVFKEFYVSSSGIY